MTETEEKTLSYHALKAERWAELDPIFEAHCASVPSPETSVAMVAENDDGEIVGLLMLQPVFHVEPLWIREDMRGKVSWMRLQQGICDLLASHGGTQVFAFATDGHMGRMAELAGFEKCEGWTIYRKEVM